MKINLVATGGTIGSRVNKSGALVISDDATAQIANIIGADKVFGEFKVHSAGVDFSALNRLRLEIERAVSDKPDGVIVTHGTDTLAYYSAYLAYAFASTRIPIVMCASDLPLTDVDSNGFDVLKSAVSFIGGGRAGVYVLYKNPGEVVRLHHAARLVPAHLHENFYFSIGDGNEFSDTGAMRGMNFDLSTGKKVLCIAPYVGIDYAGFDISGYSAVVQVAYHSGRVDSVELSRFAKANASVPIFLTAGRKKYSETDFPPNVVLCPGITQSALYIKLLIGLNNNVKNLTEFVNKNVCGEIIRETQIRNNR